MWQRRLNNILRDIGNNTKTDVIITQEMSAYFRKNELVGHWSFNDTLCNSINPHDTPSSSGVDFLQNGKGVFFHPIRGEIRRVYNYQTQRSEERRQLDGGGYINAGYQTLTTDHFTIEAWIRPTNRPNVVQEDADIHDTSVALCLTGGHIPSCWITLQWSPRRNEFGLRITNTRIRVRDLNVIGERDHLNHVVVTCDGQQLTLQVNNDRRAETVCPAMIHRQCLLRIGRTMHLTTSQAPPKPFNGEIHTIRLYDRALSEQEIGALYGTYRENVWRDDVEFPVRLRTINDTLLEPLFHALRGNQSVTILDLRGITLDDRGAELLSDLLRNQGALNLTTLNLNYSTLSETNTRLLRNAIKSHPSLNRHLPQDHPFRDRLRLCDRISIKPMVAFTVALMVVGLSLFNEPEEEYTSRQLWGIGIFAIGAGLLTQLMSGPVAHLFNRIGEGLAHGPRLVHLEIPPFPEIPANGLVQIPQDVVRIPQGVVQGRAEICTIL